ncbi:U1 snRNP protein [Recurvomyces mirabilis]|uniref:U1 snRNP protein n=1 Tax=Recurvomyces mirabilis TaxID=574656 RepID=A0AAE0WJ66_9PEZI|nr:U1 snRNP protein [Recurvomyces mirabilis]KAK5160147.1 U1 snRNP protein [Recurvomyces mirabilis]
MAAWKQAKTAEGREYYWNTATKQTVWEKPEGFEPEAPVTADSVAINGAWKEAHGTDGKSYYYNTITNETRWEPPPAFQQQQLLRPPPQADQGFVAGGGRGGYSERDRDEYTPRDRGMNRRDTRDNGLPQKPGYDGGQPWERRQEGGYRGATAIKTDEPEYATIEQAEEAFFKLLKRSNVTPDMGWKDTLRLIIRDREYRALKDPVERRDAFEKYRVQVRAEEKDKEKERRAKVREDFRQMLKTHDDIKYYTRWKTAQPSIEREAVYKQAGSDAERRAMFEDYTSELTRHHDLEEAKKHEHAYAELKELIFNTITDRSTPWEEAKQMITTSDTFQDNKIFRSVHNVDILNLYEQRVQELDFARNESKRHDATARLRNNRKARDAFRELLSKNVEKGNIKAGTKWSDFYPLIKDDERYIDVVGTAGSSPLDLFWDVVEDQEHKLRSRRNDALDVLEAARYEMTTETSAEDFAGVMRSDPRTSDLTAEQVELIYKRLMDKVHKRAADEKEQMERSQRKAIDALRSVIKHLEPEVRVADTYQDVAARLEKYEEFQVLDSEFRRSAFDKHISKLESKEKGRAEGARIREERNAARNGSSRRPDRDDRHRRDHRRSRSPEIDAYEAERKRAQADRERQYRKASFGLTPPPRERRRGSGDIDRYDGRYEDRGHDDRGGRRRGGSRERESIYDRERREREMERERSYISRADPRDKGRTLDYGDEDAGSNGGGNGASSVRKRRESEVSVMRDAKRVRRTRTPEPSGVLKEPEEEPREVRSGSEDGEIEEV